MITEPPFSLGSPLTFDTQVVVVSDTLAHLCWILLIPSIIAAFCCSSGSRAKLRKIRWCSFHAPATTVGRRHLHRTNQTGSRRFGLLPASRRLRSPKGILEANVRLVRRGPNLHPR